MPRRKGAAGRNGPVAKARGMSAAEGPGPPPGAAPRRLEHPTGATVLVDTACRAPGIAVHLLSPATDDTGVAHLLEHLIFRGNPKDGSDDLYAEMMFSAPVRDLNASTLSGHTTYHLTSSTPQGRDEAALKLLGMILAPVLDPRRLDEERAIVASEMAGHWADPQAAALEGLRGLLLPGERAAQAGLAELVKAVTLDEVATFHRRHYHAAGLFLHLTGAEPEAAFWPDLDRVLTGAAAKPLPARPPVMPMALPMPLPHDSGVPGFAWLLPGLGPRAVEVLRATLEALMPGARCCGGVESGVADLRLVGPAQAPEDARLWLERFRDRMTTAEASAALRSHAQRAFLRGQTLEDRRAAVVQAWRSGADPVSALSQDETPLLRLWAGSGSLARQDLMERLHFPAVALVFRSGQHVPAHEPSARPAPFPLPKPASRAAGQPQYRLLSLCDLPTEDLATAGALLRGQALRQGMLMTPLLPGPWVGYALPPGADGRLPAALPPLTRAASLPLHLRVERRLWAALTPEGATLSAFESTGTPAEAARIWKRLCARPLVPAIEPVVSGPRPAPPLPDPEQRITGRLSTLGLGVALGDEPLLSLIAHALEWQWLRQKIRIEGGAYGVRCRVGPGGALVFLAARDPAPPEVTLAHFARSADWLRSRLRGETLSAAIRGTLEKLAPTHATPWEERLARWQSALDPRLAPERLCAAVAGATETQLASLADRLAEALPNAVRLVFRGSD